MDENSDKRRNAFDSQLSTWTFLTFLTFSTFSSRPMGVSDELATRKLSLKKPASAVRPNIAEPFDPSEL